MLVTDKDIDAGTEFAQGLGVDFFKLDVSQEREWERLENEWPQIDVLVNNAGVTGFEEGVVAG